MLDFSKTLLAALLPLGFSLLGLAAGVNSFRGQRRFSGHGLPVPLACFGGHDA